ncbi:hypothetical protein C8R46DRAFT_1197820 [Mycena filopes]|nr:hypothetical protein C8R46DRAFT_1197820 [Mycena filopes]
MTVCWKCGASPKNVTQISAGSTTLMPPLLDLPPLDLPPPELKHLLETNDIPIEAEASALRDIIANHRGQAAILTAQIHRLRGIVNQLIEKQQDMVHAADTYYAVLSPLRRFPSELLCEIFTAALPPRRPDDAQTVLNPPWYLGHISKFWRDTALTYPPLWSSIDVLKSVRGTQPSLPALQTQLRRSGNASLALNFRWRVYDEDSSNASDGTVLLDALVHHSDRWFSARFDLDTSILNQLLDCLHPATERLGRLEKLEFGSLPLTHATTIFSTAPRLRVALLTTYNYACYSSPVVLPWTQITSFRGFYSLEATLEILQAASTIFECVLMLTDQVDNAVNTVPPHRVIAAPSLRRLHIENGSFLNHLIAPLLEHLYCEALTEMADELPSFIRRSSCRLTALFLRDRWLARDLIPVLRGATPLTTLCLLAQRHSQEKEAKTLLREMTIPGAAHDDLVLCPNLTSLTFGERVASDHRSALMDLFVPMVESRIHPDRPSRLACVWLLTGLPNAKSLILMRQVQPLRDGGLDLKLLSTEEGFSHIARQTGRDSFLPSF